MNIHNKIKLIKFCKIKKKYDKLNQSSFITNEIELLNLILFQLNAGEKHSQTKINLIK